MSSTLLAPSAVGVGGVSAADTTVVPGNLLVCGNIIGGGVGAGVSQLVAGTNVTLSPPTGTGVVTVNATAAAGGVTSVTASGAGITATPTSGAVVVANTGVTSLVAGGGVSVSGPAGAVTVANTGVTSLVAGAGVSVSGPAGAVTVANTGVTSIVAGTNVTVSGASGAVTVNASGGSLRGFGQYPAAAGVDTTITPTGTCGRILLGAVGTPENQIFGNTSGGSGWRNIGALRLTGPQTVNKFCILSNFVPATIITGPFPTTVVSYLNVYLSSFQDGGDIVLLVQSNGPLPSSPFSIQYSVDFALFDIAP